MYQPNHSSTANHAREGEHSHDDGRACGTVPSVLVGFDGPEDDGSGQRDERDVEDPDEYPEQYAVLPQDLLVRPRYTSD